MVRIILKRVRFKHLNKKPIKLVVVLLFSILIKQTSAQINKIDGQTKVTLEFTDFQINGKSAVPNQADSPLKFSINETREITLPFKQSKQFTIVYDIKEIDYRNNVMYACKLEGFDKEWTYVGKEKKISYANLEPGKYLFIVKASFDGKQWSPENEISLIIKISFPFYNTWWFYLILGIIVILIVTGASLYVVSKNKLKVKIKETERKLFESELMAIRAQLNPHFLFNSLSSIQNLINKNDSEASNIYLSKFASLLRSILDNSEKSKISLADELSALTAYIELEALRFRFRYKIDIDPRIDLDNLEIPAMLLQPIVENAINHGLAYLKTERNLSISVMKTNTGIFFTIDDNGIGINKAKELKQTNFKKKHLGLKLTEERLRMLNENSEYKYSIEILDKFAIGNLPGTVVNINIPIAD